MEESSAWELGVLHPTLKCSRDGDGGEQRRWRHRAPKWCGRGMSTTPPW